MSNFAQVPVSLFDGSFDSHPQRTVTLQYILEGVGSGRYSRQVRHVRQILATRGKADYDTAKRSLPAVTFAGTFDPTRGNAHLKAHSGLLHIDLDHLKDVSATKQVLSDDPYLVFAFTSPSGMGLKAGVRIPPVTSAEHYAHAWRVVKADYEQRYGVCWGPATKDVARLCYVSYDPELFVNLDAAVFDVPPVPAPEPRPPTPKRSALVPYQPDRRRMYAERAIRTAVDMIQAAPLGTRHHTRLKAARLLGGYVAGGVLTDEEAYGPLAQALVGHTEDLKRALDTVEDGLRYGQAHPITLEALEAEREAWLREHRATVTHRYPPDDRSPHHDDPWSSMYTLPLRPSHGLQVRKAVTHG